MTRRKTEKLHRAGNRRPEQQTGTLQSGAYHGITVAVGLLCLLSAALFLAFHPITDPDTWYHLAFGRELLQSGRLPRVDVFTHTALGRAWTSSGWLTATALYAVYQSAGATGIVALVFCVVLLTFGGLFLIGIRRDGSSAGVLLLFLLPAMVVAYPRFSARPDLVAQPLMTALVFLLLNMERSGKNWRAFVLLPLLIILWANLHISVFIALIVILFFAADMLHTRRRSARQEARFARPALIALGACFCVWLLNPYGFALVNLLRENFLVPEISKRIFELKPLFALSGGGWEFPLHFTAAVIVFFAAVAFLLLNYGRSIPLWRIGSILLLLALGLLQRRQLGIAAPGVAALLLPEVSRLSADLPRLRTPALLAGIVISAAICGMRWIGILEMPRGLPRGGVDCVWFPCRATDFLEKNPPPENMFNDLYTGGYLMFRIGPETKVFIDGRNELFRHGPWQDYFAPAEGRMALTDLLVKYKIRTCVMDIRGAFETPNHAAVQLAQKPDWGLVYFDDQYGVFISEYARAYAEKHAFRFVNPFRSELLSQGVMNDQTRTAALVELDRALNLSGGSAHAHALAAQAAFQLGNREKGETHLRRAQELNPNIGISAE